VRITYSDHLVVLLGQAEAAAARLRLADQARLAALAAAARRAQARASTRLDGSPLEDATADHVDAGANPPAGGPDAAEAGAGDAGGNGWAAAMRLDVLPTQDIAAREYANLLASYDAEPRLAARLFEAPRATLVELHGIIGDGLLPPDRVGTPRRTPRAVHDGAQGQAIYHAPEPDEVPAALDSLCGWLGSTSATKPALVTAGAVHARLLEVQPFEGANGRLARAASRLVLRARGLDPHGLVTPEPFLAADPLGYHREIAATIRRRGDLGPWLERVTEAAVTALERAADVVAPEPGAAPPPRAREVAAGLPAGATLTVAEYAARAGVSRETAVTELRRLVRVGELSLQPSSSGLRYIRGVS
jgi:hypothetical protein